MGLNAGNVEKWSGERGKVMETMQKNQGSTGKTEAGARCQSELLKAAKA
jgi:hypothetical protein